MGNIDWLNIDWRVDKAPQVALELEPLQPVELLELFCIYQNHSLIV